MTSFTIFAPIVALYLSQIYLKINLEGMFGLPVTQLIFSAIIEKYFLQIFWEAGKKILQIRNTIYIHM